MKMQKNGEEVIERITIHFQASSVVESPLSSKPSILKNKKNGRDEDYLIRKTIEVLNEPYEVNEKDNGNVDAELQDLSVDLLKHCEVILNQSIPGYNQRINHFKWIHELSLLNSNRQ